MIRRLRIIVAFIALFSFACAGKTIPVIIGQVGLGVAQAIGQIQTTTKNLTDTGTLPPAVALTIQQKLLDMNDQMRPLPDLIRLLDQLQKAGKTDAVAADKAIAILQVLGSDLATLVVGVPVSETARSLLNAVVAAQQTVQTTMIEIAKMRGV